MTPSLGLKRKHRTQVEQKMAHIRNVAKLSKGVKVIDMSEMAREQVPVSTQVTNRVASNLASRRNKVILCSDIQQTKAKKVRDRLRKKLEARKARQQ